MLGFQNTLAKGAAACSNWAHAPPAVQRWCRPRQLGAHVAHPATESPYAAADQQLTLLPTVLEAQQLLGQTQQQDQPGLLTAYGIAAAAAVGQDGWPAADDAVADSAAAAASSSVDTSADASAASAASSSNGASSSWGKSSSAADSNSGGSGHHAAHFSWQAGQMQAAEDAATAEQQLQAGAASPDSIGSDSSAVASTASSSGFSSTQSEVDSRGYLVYTAADLQQELLPGLPRAQDTQQPQQQQQELEQQGPQQQELQQQELQQQSHKPLQQQQQEELQQLQLLQGHQQQQSDGPQRLQGLEHEQPQDHMQQLLQQQHELHQQVQQQHQSQPQKQPQQQQYQPQQVLQRARAPQKLDSSALKDAQIMRDAINRRLTARIRDARDLMELRSITKQYEGGLNSIQVSALFVKLTKLVTRQQLRPRDMLALQTVLSQVLALVEAAVPDMNERAITNCIHSMAVLELNQERQLLGSMLTAVEQLMRLSRLTPQSLANMTWALGSLRLNPTPRFASALLAAGSSNLYAFTGLDLAQFGWGLATMRVRVEEEWLNPWRAAVARVLPSLTPQGLSMVLWSTARLTESRMSVAAAAAAAMMASVGSSGGSSSSGSVSLQEQQWLHAVEEQLLWQLGQHTPHSVSMCLWSLGKMGYRPRTEFTGDLLEAIEPQLGSASPSDLAILLYSLAILSYRPSNAWAQAHCRAVRGRLQDLGVRRVTNLLWAHAKLGMRPSEDRLLGDMVSVLHGSLHEANTRDLASSLWALATLGYLPHKSFLEAFGAQAQSLVHDFTPQDISNLMWAYAKLGVRPPQMLLVALWESVGIAAGSSSDGSSYGGSSSSSSGVYGSTAIPGSSGGSVGARLSAFKPMELTMLVWALAVLKLVPGKAWWDQFLQSSYHKMGSQSPQGLASIIWSLSELQLQPPPAWLYHWAAAARGVLDSMNPVDLGLIAAALQGPTLKPLELQKLEVLLGEVLDKLATLEVASGAYSKAAMHMLLKMKAQDGRGSGGGSNGSSAGGTGRVRRAAVIRSSSAGSSGGSGSSQQQWQPAAAVLARVPRQHEQMHDSGGVVSSMSSVQDVGVAEDIARLKEYLCRQTVVDGMDAMDDDEPELRVTL